MDDIRKINMLEQLEQLSKEIQILIIEKRQNQNNYDEKLKNLYNRLVTLNREFIRTIPPNEKEHT
jgi:hypothetical protein